MTLTLALAFLCILATLLAPPNSGSYATPEVSAKVVIASLWPVADAITSGLMQGFYRLRESAAGMTKMRKQTGEARIAYENDPKAPYEHPFFRAPFFLMGNWL